MIQFNLKEYLKNPKRKVITRNGEDELNENEQFIDAFSNLFYQALKTME